MQGAGRYFRPLYHAESDADDGPGGQEIPQEPCEQPHVVPHVLGHPERGQLLLAQRQQALCDNGPHANGTGTRHRSYLPRGEGSTSSGSQLGAMSLVARGHRTWCGLFPSPWCTG